MGKKGGPKGKGKPVVMTQAEFFQQSNSAAASASAGQADGWANIFGEA